MATETDLEREARTWACYNALRMMLQLAVGRGSDGRDDLYGPLRGVAQAIALLAEQSPENKTPRDIKKMIDQFADMAKFAALEYRKEFELTRVHPIETILNASPDQGGDPAGPIVGNA